MKKLKLAKFRYKNVIMNLYYSNLKSSKAIILAHGLPDVPLYGSEQVVLNFVNRGFLVFSPHYIGTFDSFGKCNFENSVDTILDTIDFVKKGTGKELWDNKRISWKIKQIILAGGSFGGSVVLVAGAKSKDIQKIIVLAPPTDYRIQGKKYRDESIMKDYFRVKRGCINTWRVSDKKIWQKLDKGELDLNPVDYADILKNKNILIVHGTKDDAVDIRQTIGLYNKINDGKGNHKFIKIKGLGHIGIRGFNDKKIFNQTIRWLK